MDAPTRIPVIWASSAGGGYVNVIPEAPTSPGYASFEEGFPPITFVSRFAGGIPPRGADANGIFRQITAGLQWLQGGGPMPYDATFAADIGGYPIMAIISSDTTPGLLWVNIAANNLTDPDAGGAGWVAAPIAGVRIRLLQNTTFYVATTGSDSNSGLTVGAPWATIQKAATTIQNGYDLNGFVATISIAPGTYAAGALINGFVPGATSPASIVFSATGGSVVVNGVGYAFGANQGAMFRLEGNGFTLAATLSSGLGACVVSTGGAKVEIGGQVTYSTADQAHVLAATGGQVVYFAQETISGDSPIHFYTHANGVITANSVGATLVGIPNFSTSFAFGDESGTLEAIGYTVVSGSATGQRYSFLSNASGNVGGGGPLVFPGDVAGTTDGFGFYG